MSVTERELASAVRERARDGILVATDFDGTLSEIVLDPAAAALHPDCRAPLEALARREAVAVLSGRGLDDLRARVPVEGAVLAGEHGADVLFSGGQRMTRAPTIGCIAAFSRFAEHAAEILAGTGGHVERKRLAVAAHVRRAAEGDRERLEQLLAKAAAALEDRDVHALRGRCVVELRARIATKANGLRTVRGVIGTSRLVVALGDDATDEDLFREAHEAGGTSIRVGDGASIAHHRLPDPAGVARFLAELAGS